MTEQAVGWALHALEPDEEMAVARHVPQCADCQAVVKDVEETFVQLGAAIEQVEPPASLRASIMSAVAETPQQPVTRLPVAPSRHAAAPATPRRISRPRRMERSSRWSRGTLVGASMALVAVLAIGGLTARTIQLQQQRDSATAQAASITDLVSQIDRPGVEHAVLADASGAPVAAVLVAGGRSQVVAMAMAANAGDHTYVLWGIRAGESPQPLGAFDVSGSTEGLRTVGSGGGFSTYAISLEPGRVAPAVPTDVVAKGQVAV
ncbi:anti-sigma factor [Pseudonocardia sp. GCM10023141]|uniref:anti-sigma factor n=1 Tax=Pseudonocardia sp. GCM10023141 TaxID=3252653 RepID=UPI003616A018